MSETEGTNGSGRKTTTNLPAAFKKIINKKTFPAGVLYATNSFRYHSIQILIALCYFEGEIGSDRNIFCTYTIINHNKIKMINIILDCALSITVIEKCIHTRF